MCCKDWNQKPNGRFSLFSDTQMICKASKGTVKYLTENSDNSLNFLKRNKVNYVLPIDVPLTCILCIYNQRDHFHITGTSCHVTG